MLSTILAHIFRNHPTDTSSKPLSVITSIIHILVGTLFITGAIMIILGGGSPIWALIFFGLCIASYIRAYRRFKQ